MDSEASKNNYFEDDRSLHKLLHVKEEERKFADKKSYSSISLKHYDSFLGDLRCPGLFDRIQSK
jgi:hypothetical protein